MTTIGLDNTGFLKFGTDIEMGDEGVFNTTGSRLWQKVVLLFQNELKEQYSLMRQDRFTVDNIMKYLYGEQISQIPATFYNKDMQTKYLNFGSAYLYALHGSSEQHIKKWIRERIMYVDTLLGYMTSSADYITLRSSKLGYVYLDIQTYIPMYVSVKWRDEANNTGLQTKRVGKGETVRFEYNMPTATDQEILVYAGYYLKSLGDVSNLQPTSMLIANASRLTEIECHSPNLINTDLSECKLLQKIDLRDSTALGTGIGAQPILNIQNCQYLRYCDCYNTQLTAIYTMQQGGNLEEIYYPSTVQVVQLQNQEYLHTVGIPYDEAENIACENLQQVTIENCNNIKYIQYPFEEGEKLNFKAFKYVQNLSITNSLEDLTSMNFAGFKELKTITLASLRNLASLNFNDMLSVTDVSNLTAITISDCPLIEKVTFNVSSDAYKVEFAKGCKIDLGGMQTVKTIESNTKIIGLDTLIIPTSTKELKFTRSASGEPNEIKSIFSASASHAYDNFVGLDLLDIRLTHLDMSSLSITNALNFYLAPTTQHPNLNTYRDGVNQPYFCPDGVLDLSNYTGRMNSMFKGLDFNTLKIIMPTGTFMDTDISSLFEGAIIPTDLDIVEIMEKFPFATNFNYIFKGCNIKDASNIPFPTQRFTLKEGFMNSALEEDFDLPLQVTDITSCFENCLQMTRVRSHWNRNFSFNPSHEDCYANCVNIIMIDGASGKLRNIPTDWGGLGFVLEELGEYTVEILTNDYTLVFGDIVGEGGVEWGDGAYSLGETSHTFENPGIYTISGQICPNVKNQEPNETVKNTLVSVTKLPSTVDSFANMFADCKLLRFIDLTSTDTKTVKNTSGMLRNCTSLNTPPTFDYTGVLNMGEMFKGCINISAINFKNLMNSGVDCVDIFEGCVNLLTLGFEGKVSKEAARKVIEDLNEYILENFASTNSLSEEMAALSLRATSLEEQQSAQGETLDALGEQQTTQGEMINTLGEQQISQGEMIENISEQQTVQGEETVATMLALTSIYENFGVTMSTMSNDTKLSAFDEQMIIIYTTLILKGYKTLDNVPYTLKEPIKEKLKKG